MSRKNLLASGLLLIAVVSRVIPHIPNFTPVESIALFSGVYIASRKMSFLLPIIGIYFADLILNNTIYRSFFAEDSAFIWISGYMLWTFIAMAGIIVFGKILKTRLKPLNVIGFSVAGSLLFFIISNFGVWLGSVAYPKNITGLIECYTLALPFFRNSLLSNVVFTIVMFGSMEWILRYRFSGVKV